MECSSSCHLGSSSAAGMGQASGLCQGRDGNVGARMNCRLRGAHCDENFIRSFQSNTFGRRFGHRATLCQSGVRRKGVERQDTRINFDGMEDEADQRLPPTSLGLV